MQDDYPMNNPTPFQPIKGETVLHLDSTARRIAARRILDARMGRPDDDKYDRGLQELLLLQEERRP
jgi:hypothetical protein